MNILPLQNTISNKIYSTPQIKADKNYNPIYSSTSIYFYGILTQPKNQEELAQKSLNSATKYLNKAKGIVKPYLYSFNLDKLNGIQTGIKTFEGLSIKEIGLILNNLSTIMVKRGCSNRCSHCFCEAIPQHFTKDSNLTSSISWEDFGNFFNDYEQLKNRLGFDVIHSDKVISLFHDADCVEIEMKDKNGKVYDFADASELLLNKTPCRELFDTSGWNPKSGRLQKRAEKIVQFLAKNANRMNQINISVNPFHALLEKSNECIKAGDIVNAKYFRNLYTDRMANTIFTFTPILDSVSFILRTKSDNQFHSERSLRTIEQEILIKLEEMYNKDSASSQKYAKNKTQVYEIMAKVKRGLNKKSYEIASLGRAKNFFINSEDKSFWSIYSDLEMFFGELKRKSPETFIDANGQIYVSNSYLTSPTKMQLNFSNKDKKTIPPAKIIEESSVKVANNIIDKFILEN